MRVPDTVVDPQADNASPEALVSTFEVLLADADVDTFFRILGIGRLARSARRRMYPVFTALCAGLWRLAMKMAVPDRCDEACERYMAWLQSNGRDADAQVLLLRDVAAHLPPNGGEDFTPAAREVFSRAGKTPDQAGLVGMALFLRRLYDYFFNHLM